VALGGSTVCGGGGPVLPWGGPSMGQAAPGEIRRGGRHSDLVGHGEIDMTRARGSSDWWARPLGEHRQRWMSDNRSWTTAAKRSSRDHHAPGLSGGRDGEMATVEPSAVPTDCSRRCWRGRDALLFSQATATRCCPMSPPTHPTAAGAGASPCVAMVSIVAGTLWLGRLAAHSRSRTRAAWMATRIGPRTVTTTVAMATGNREIPPWG